MDVHKQSHIAAERGGETTLSLRTRSFQKVAPYHSIHLVVTSRKHFDVTLTVKLAHARDASALNLHAASACNDKI